MMPTGLAGSDAKYSATGEIPEVIKAIAGLFSEDSFGIQGDSLSTLNSFPYPLLTWEFYLLSTVTGYRLNSE